MVSSRPFAASVVVVGVAALVHAALTWPQAAVVAFFGGGAVVAFVAEAAVINAGWLDHHVGPKAVGVPLYVLFGWTGAVYLAFRVARLVAEGWPAVALAAALATGYDVLADPRALADGHWTYTDDLPGPRFREVPWWNFAGWLVVSALTAGFGTLAL